MKSETVRNLSPTNRRASRRLPPKGQLKIECRKGAHGLGINVARQVLDVSETGIRLILGIELSRNSEVEVILGGTSYMAPVKRIARVVWSIPAEDLGFVTGLNFSPPLDYPSFLHLCASMRQLR